MWKEVSRSERSGCIHYSSRLAFAIVETLMEAAMKQMQQAQADPLNFLLRHHVGCW